MSQNTVTTRVAENGRLSIPAKHRKMLGLDHGGVVVLAVDDGVLTIRPLERVLTDIQDRVQRILGPSDGTAVDDFLAERRREGLREEEEARGL